MVDPNPAAAIQGLIAGVRSDRSTRSDRSGSVVAQ
jgi:hypothetical protein